MASTLKSRTWKEEHFLCFNKLFLEKLFSLSFLLCIIENEKVQFMTFKDPKYNSFIEKGEQWLEFLWSDNEFLMWEILRYWSIFKTCILSWHNYSLQLYRRSNKTRAPTCRKKIMVQFWLDSKLFIAFKILVILEQFKNFKSIRTLRSIE